MAKKKSHAHHEHHAKSSKENNEHKDRSTGISEVVSKKDNSKVFSSKPKNLKLLSDAPVENYFMLCNGQPVKNVKALADILEKIEDEVFNHHVTLDKNDFATWIKDIFEDVDLANELAGIKDRGNMRLVLYKHLTNHLVK